MARPMPLLAPVTNTVLSFKRMRDTSLTIPDAGEHDGNGLTLFGNEGSFFKSHPAAQLDGLRLGADTIQKWLGWEEPQIGFFLLECVLQNRDRLGFPSQAGVDKSVVIARSVRLGVSGQYLFPVTRDAGSFEG